MSPRPHGAAHAARRGGEEPRLEHFFCPCPRGLERVLEAELAALGARAPGVVDGGVGFGGRLDLACEVNLRSRIASRVLWRLWEGPYRSEADVYEAVRAWPWPKYFEPRLTIRVNVAATGSPLRSLEFITLRIKDAVCDRFRADCGRRPSVDTAAPDVRIHAHFEARRFSLSLDTSGEPLFKRGYRHSAGEAPLRENLAAGILALAEWKPGTPLLDPMCGAGTILVEAAQIALAIPPGATRAFAFEKLAPFDHSAWLRIKRQALAETRPMSALAVYGSDRYGSALELARANLAAAGLEQAVSLKQANVLEVPAPAPHGTLVTNPPYGVRLSEQQELADLYPKLGDALKQRFAGWRAYIFTADLRLPKLIGLKPSRRIPLYNGALECRLYGFELVAGAMRRQKDSKVE